MADVTVTPASVPPQPNPLLSPQELEALAKIVRNRNRGFLPTAAECDVLVELILRHLGGER